MKLPKLFVPDKDLEDEVERLLKKEVKLPNYQLKYANVNVVEADTYAGGIAKLRKQGFRPFSFAESIKVRIAAYESNVKNAELFDTYLNSVTGVAYREGSTKLKLILKSDKLEGIPQGFKHNYLPVDYDSEKGIELDVKNSRYNQLLTIEEVRNHEFWIAALDGDKALLNLYANFWFDRTGAKKGMGVYLRSNTSQNELRALVLNDGDFYSHANGNYNLLGNARFVSGAQ